MFAIWITLIALMLITTTCSVVLLVKSYKREKKYYGEVMKLIERALQVGKEVGKNDTERIKGEN